MPLLDNRSTKTVNLPISGGTVTIYEGFTAADVEAIRQSESDVVYPVSCLIKDWDFVDEKDEPVPVTKENVGKLDIRDMRTIENAIDLSDFLAGENPTSGSS